MIDIVDVYKFSLFDVISDIIKNKHTNITITYHLLLKNKIDGPLPEIKATGILRELVANANKTGHIVTLIAIA